MIGRLDKGATITGVSADSPELPSRLARQLWCDSLTYQTAKRCTQRSTSSATTTSSSDRTIRFQAMAGATRRHRHHPAPPTCVAGSAAPIWRSTMGALPGSRHDPLSPCWAGTDEHMADPAALDAQ